MIPGIVAGALASGGGVPWGDVIALLHFDGTNGSATFTDETGRTWTRTGDAQIATADPKWGTGAGLFDGTGDRVGADTAAGDFELAGDFTIECWVNRANVNPLFQSLFTCRSTGGVFLGLASGKLTFGAFASSDDAQSPSVLANSVWTHVAACRSGTTLRLFEAGIQTASVTNSTIYVDGGNTNGVLIGNNFSSNTGYNGLMDDLRVLKGFAAYTANFTPPDGPFPNS